MKVRRDLRCMSRFNRRFNRVVDLEKLFFMVKSAVENGDHFEILLQ